MGLGQWSCGRSDGLSFNSWTLFPVLLGPLGPGVTFAWHSFQGTCLCTLRCASCYRRFSPLLVFLFPHPLPTMPWCLILYDKTGSCFNGSRQESRDQERYRVAGSSHKSLVTRWSSPVARQAHNLKVVSSNLAPATNSLCFNLLNKGFFLLLDQSVSVHHSGQSGARLSLN